MGYVLAMYDIRGKQDFIFRTNKLREIAGGSWIIRDCFKDYLFPAAKEYNNGKGIFSYKDNPADEYAAFSKEGFLEHLKDDYTGEVVYDGGGNFLVLYKNGVIFREVTYRFTRALMKNIGTLRVLATCVEVDEELNDFVDDRKKLYARHRENESQESIISPWSCIPIVQVDRATSQPIIIGKTNGEYSRERKMKIDKFRREFDKAEYKTWNNEEVFDNIIKKKGEDSQLAIIYIDGNNMGAKVQACLGNGDKGKKGENDKSYEACVSKLRSLSDKIQKIYVEKGIEAVMGSEQTGNKHRIVVSAGDEVNFIVRAEEALKCVKAYLDIFREKDEDEGNGKSLLENGHSSCAGIAVFHSHSPYSEAYRIAEECCESGKTCMKEAGMSTACFVDYHICQGAIGISLDKIRDRENAFGVEGGDKVLSRPWMIDFDKSYKGNENAFENEKKPEAEITKFEDISRLAEMFNKLGRSNVKNLASSAMKGEVELELELKRIRAHQSNKIKEELEGQWDELDRMDKSKKRSMIYDVVIAYDLWFRRECGQGSAREA